MRRSWIALGCCLLPAFLPAQAQRLDLNQSFVLPETPSTYPAYFTRVGNEVAFFGRTRENAAVLCYSDGTAQGTRLVHSFPLHYDDHNTTTMFGFGSQLLFTRHRIDTGFELWCSDGTDAGTRLLRDFLPGPASGLPGPTVFVEFQGLVWFAAADPAHGLELWRTDGTEAGTQLAADLWQGPTGSGITAIEVAGGRLFLLAGDGAYGRELWVSDGTQAGTHMVADLSMNSDISNLMAIGSGVVFSTSERTYGNELFFSDGTSAGTHVLMDLVPGVGSSTPKYLQRFGAEIVYVARDAQGVWRSFRTDGTPAGTVPMLPQWTFSEYFFPVLASGSTLFVWRPAANTGWDLWRTDGTTVDSNPVLTTMPMSGYFNVWAVAANGGLFAAFDDGVHGREPWFVPTQGPAMLIGDLFPGTSTSTTNFVTGLGNEVWFPADDGVHGIEPWVWSATTGAAHMVADLSPPLPSSSARPVCAIGEDLVFTARTDAVTAGLWRTDGTLQGTVPLQLWPTSANPGAVPLSWWLATDHQRSWLSHDDGMHGRELWVTDGTVAGTALVQDLTPGPADSYIQSAVLQGDRLLFCRYTSLGSELWISDGSAVGTSLVQSPFQASEMCRIGDVALLAAYANGSGNAQLWRSDGTGPGTTLVATNLNVQRLVGLDSFALVFTYNAGLWRSDGTAAGTWQVLANAPQPSGIIARCGDWVVYSASDGQGYEPWRSDGTAAGTYRLADINPGPSSSTSTLFRAACAMDRVFFTAWSPNEGTELWSTDGTPQGTNLVRDLMPGPLSALANGRLALGQDGRALTENRRLVFLAEDLVRGEEFWVTDGTAAGTQLLADAAPGSASSWTQSFVRAGERIYWQGFDAVTGYELWSLSLANAGLSAKTTFGTSCDLGNTAPRIAAVDVPRLGNPAFGLRLTAAPPSAFALLLWNVLREGTQFGACTLHPSLPVLSIGFVSDAAGNAFATAPIPNDPGFLGMSLFAQWLVAAPGGPLLGLGVASDAVHVVVGS